MGSGEIEIFLHCDWLTLINSFRESFNYSVWCITSTLALYDMQTNRSMKSSHYRFAASSMASYLLIPRTNANLDLLTGIALDTKLDYEVV